MLIEWIERIARKTAERVVPNAMADEWDRLARTKYADRPAVADKLQTMARKARALNRDNGEKGDRK